MQENQQQTLTFKVKLGDEIRRFSVPANSEWKDINAKINTLFSIANNERVTVKYEDDEKELVTIDSTAELQEIKRMYGSQCVRLDLTKVAAETPVSVSSPAVSSENLNNNNNNSNHGNEFARSWRQHGGKRKEWKRHDRKDCHERKEWKRKQCEMSREELSEKLKILEDKGYKCKWRNCKMLRMYNGDVDKVCEAFLEHQNRRGKFGEALQQLDSQGFTDKVINIKLLKRYHGDVNKVADVLAKAKKFEGVGCCKWRVLRLLEKYDGNVEEVEKIWAKKKEHFEKKAQRKREKEVRKYECKWKKGKNKRFSSSSSSSSDDSCDKTTKS